MGILYYECTDEPSHFPDRWKVSCTYHMKMEAPCDECVDDRPSGPPLQKISYTDHMKSDAPHCFVHVDRTSNNSPKWKISHKRHM